MHTRLIDADIGSTLRVIGYDQASSYTATLTRLGLVPGTEFVIERVAPLGDPIEIRLRGYSLALRPSEAHALQLELITE